MPPLPRWTSLTTRTKQPVGGAATAASAGIREPSSTKAATTNLVIIFTQTPWIDRCPYRMVVATEVKTSESTVLAEAPNPQAATKLQQPAHQIGLGDEQPRSRQLPVERTGRSAPQRHVRDTVWRRSFTSTHIGAGADGVRAVGAGASGVRRRAGPPRTSQAAAGAGCPAARCQPVRRRLEPGPGMLAR